MTEAPKRIWASIEDDRQDPETSAYYVGGSFDAGEFKQGQEYVRADIADKMLEALKEIERIYYLEGKNAIYRAAHMRGVAERMIGAVEDKAEGDDT